MINWIIIAAGKGSRMNSALPKVLHKINGKTMIEILANFVTKLSSDNSDKKVIVVSNDIYNNFSDLLPKGFDIVVQSEQLGTAHAVIAALSKLSESNAKTIILYGDTVFVKEDTILKKIDLLNQYQCVNIAFIKKEPNKYAKMLYSEAENINYSRHSVIETFGTKEEKSFLIDEPRPILCNGGIMSFQTKFMIDNINTITADPITKEFYLPLLLNIAYDKYHKPSASIICEEDEIFGIDTQDSLTLANNISSNN